MNPPLMLVAAALFLMPIVGHRFDFDSCNCKMRGYVNDTGQIATACPRKNCNAQPNGSPKAPCLPKEVTYAQNDIRTKCLCTGAWGGGLWADADCGCEAWVKMAPNSGTDCEGVQCYECHWVDPTGADLADVCECSK